VPVQEEKTSEKQHVKETERCTMLKRVSPRIAAVVAAVCAVIIGLGAWGLASALPTSTGAPDVAPLSAGTASSTSAAGTGQAEQSASDEGTAGGSGDGSGANGTAQGTGPGGEGGAGATNGGSEGSGGSDGSATQAITVTLIVDCTAAVEAGSTLAAQVSNNGAMIHATLRLNEGSSVLDALRASGAVVGANGGSMGSYVYSINSLGERAAGPQSGWAYYVNSTKPRYSCDKYILHEGDYVEWRYVLSP
jgi:hypothetical protein